MKSVSANLPEYVVDRLRSVAQSEDRTLSQQIARILRLWVEEHHSNASEKLDTPES